MIISKSDDLSNLPRFDLPTAYKHSVSPGRSISGLFCKSEFCQNFENIQFFFSSLQMAFFSLSR